MPTWEVVTEGTKVIARFDHTPYLGQWARSLAEATGCTVEFAADVPELIAGTTAALDDLTAVSA